MVSVVVVLIVPRPCFCRLTLGPICVCLLKSPRFPETWTVGGVEVKYTPNLGNIPDGKYKSGDPLVVKEHVKALDYSLMDLSIISCKSAWIVLSCSIPMWLFSHVHFLPCLSVSTGWGESDRLDRARITQLLDETTRQQSPLKWSIYYEDERANNYSVNDLVEDLNYLKKWFGKNVAQE